MSLVHDYRALKSSLLALSKELINHIESIWTNGWSEQTPIVGVHFNYWDIKDLPTYEVAISELGKVPSIYEKYSETSLEKPVGAFLELVISSIPNPSFVEKAVEYWWEPFRHLLEAKNVPIKLYIGLSNFKSDQSEYRYDKETAVCFYGDKSLESILRDFPQTEPFSSTGEPMHIIPGAIQVEFSLPANRNTLEHNLYSRECINRMIPLKDALRLSSFGRLFVGPWVPICNPPFPIDGIRSIGFPDDRKRFNEAIFHLDDDSWARFSDIYRHLKKIQSEDDLNVEAGRAARRRFTSAISRFVGTFEQGYWESVVVDLVILMESLLTPNRQGGRMQLALAASNLLGTTTDESKEIFDNVTNMYKLRNTHVHGEPMTNTTWENRILEIAKVAGSTSEDFNDEVRMYAFEVMRDYARRSIVGMLNLHYFANMSPSEALTSDLHQLHLDKNLRESIQSSAKCYGLNSRPELPI